VRLLTVDDEISHLRIFNFAETTNKDLLAALERFKDSGASGFVLDLRNNPGGLLTSVVNVTSQFLDDGLVLYQVNAQGDRTDWKVKSGGKAKDIPFVILVNEFSASASEVFTGAMMDHERATVIGTTTFGKGSVSNLWSLQDGSGVNFTIAHWFTPEGTLIEGEGITPDIVLEKPEDDSEDVHLEQAIDLLRKKIAQGN
jgi:carboxyl-terminal processing protease